MKIVHTQLQARTCTDMHIQTQGSIYWGGGGGGILSQTLQLRSPQNFCQLSLTKSYNVLAKNLSAISQLQGPWNCLKMPQNHSQKAQNSKTFCGGMPPDPPGVLRPMPATPIHYHFNIFHPKTKILDRTLRHIYIHSSIPTLMTDCWVCVYIKIHLYWWLSFNFKMYWRDLVCMSWCVCVHHMGCIIWI